MIKLSILATSLFMVAFSSGCASRTSRLVDVSPESVMELPDYVTAESTDPGLPGETVVSYSAHVNIAPATRAPTAVGLRPEMASKSGVLLIGRVPGVSVH